MIIVEVMVGCSDVAEVVVKVIVIVIIWNTM